MNEKLAAVLGIPKPKFQDPDPTYVLTVDNLMKMLAIHMRFRYVVESLPSLYYVRCQLLALLCDMYCTLVHVAIVAFLLREPQYKCVLMCTRGNFCACLKPSSISN